MQIVLFKTFISVGVVLTLIGLVALYFGLFDDAQILSSSIAFGVVVLMSLLGGILSSNALNSSWLGSALFMRHINAKISNRNIQYLKWTSDGNVSIVNPREVKIRWDSQTNTVLFIHKREKHPFFHLAPVKVNGHNITSASRDVLSFYNGLNSSWKEILTPYRDAIQHAEIRVAWIVLMFIAARRDPNSLTTDKNKISLGAQSVEVEGKQKSIRWNHPTQKWEDSISEVFLSDGYSPVLQTIFCSSIPISEPHPNEFKLLEKVHGEGEKMALLGAERNFLSLVTVLFDNVSSRRNVVSDITRDCIRHLSRWFKDLKNKDSFSQTLIFISHENKNHPVPFFSCYDWADTYNQIINNPSSLYFSLYNKLINISNSSEIPVEVVALIQGAITSTTKDIISANRKPPTSAERTSIEIPKLLDGQQIDVAHKSRVVAGALELQFIYQLIRGEGK
jgi:hypothetical protein